MWMSGSARSSSRARKVQRTVRVDRPGSGRTGARPQGGIAGTVAVVGELPRDVESRLRRKATVTVKNIQPVAEGPGAPLRSESPPVHESAHEDGRRSRWTEHRRARREDLVGAAVRPSGAPAPTSPWT